MDAFLPIGFGTPSALISKSHFPRGKALKGHRQLVHDLLFEPPEGPLVEGFGVLSGRKNQGRALRPLRETGALGRWGSSGVSRYVDAATSPFLRRQTKKTCTASPSLTIALFAGGLSAVPTSPGTGLTGCVVLAQPPRTIAASATRNVIFIDLIMGSFSFSRPLKRAARLLKREVSHTIVEHPLRWHEGRMKKAARGEKREGPEGPLSMYR